MSGSPPVPTVKARSLPPGVLFDIAPLVDRELPQLFVADELSGASFPAARQQLELLCDQIFGVDRDWVPHPDDEVLVDWGRVHGVPVTGVAAPPPDASVMASSFVCLRILVVSRDVVEEPEPRDVRVVVTHLFVDHAWAMTYGREIFGFPAIFAEIKPLDRGVQVSLEIGEFREMQPVLTLAWYTPSGSTPPPANDFWEMIRALPSASALPAIPFIQVKQMRDGIDATRACYQGLIDGQLRIQAVKLPVARAHVTLAFPAPHALNPAELGLGNPVQEAHGYHTENLELTVQVQSHAQSPVLRTGRAGPSLRQRQGDPQAAPPYLFTDVEIVGFRIPVRQQALQNLCDKWLNDPFPGRSYRYQPANVDLVIECLHYPSMTSENPPPGVSPEQATSQRELVFRILVGQVDEDGRSIRAPAVFCPFLFVDNTASLISGREVIGYPKLLADFAPYGEAVKGQFEACKIVATTPDASSRAPQNLLTFDCRFDRDPRDVEQLFGTELRGAKGPGASPGIRIPFEFAWWGLADLQSGGLNETLIEPWLGMRAYGYAGLQVKRFPDARNPRRECYHEIVGCDYTLIKAEVSLPMHDARLHFPAEDIYGLTEAFGFAPVVPVPPASWYRTKADFAFRVIDPLA